MNRKTRLHMRLLTAAVMLAATPLAFAAGTDANTLIQNVAKVDFKVNNNQQTQQQNDATSAQFRVDRLVTFTVVADAATVSTNPNQTGAVLSYTVTNNSNDTLDFNLDFEQSFGDSFDATGVVVYAETDGTAGYTTADTLTYIDELAPGASKVVYIVGNIPQAALQSQTDAFYVVATAAQGGTANSEGTALAAAATNDAMTVENVFGEGASGGAAVDGDNDGQGSAISAFTVDAASITVDKKFVVLNDPVNGTTDPHPIPGASVLYCITVTNGGSGQTATDVTISDAIPAGTTFVTGSIETFTSAVTCAATGLVGTGTAVTDGAGFDGTTVTTTNGTLAAGNGTSTIFKVTINP